MKITYYGHSGFAAEINGKHLLFDPFITQNSLAKAIDIKKIKADYIFVSHAHFDHIADAVTIANQTGATVISNYEMTSWLGKNGVKNAQPLNPGGTYSSDFGRVKCVNAIHSSSFEDGTYGGGAGGFVVESAESNFYYSGDTALTLDMQLISYEVMRLDTSVRQAEANGLYRRLGFQTIEPYYELPEDVRNWLIFMELKL